MAYLESKTAHFNSGDISSIVSWKGGAFKNLGEVKLEQLVKIFKKKMRGAKVHEVQKAEVSMISRALRKIADNFTPSSRKVIHKNIISKIVYLSAVDEQTVDDYTNIFLALKKD